MSMDYVLTDANVYVDDKTLAGSVRTVTLPKVEEKTEEHLGAGMMFPQEINVSFNKLEATFEYPEFNPEVMQKEAEKWPNDLPMTVYGYLRGEDGQERGAEAHLRGRFRGLDMGAWKVGAVNITKATFICRYYELTINGTQLYRIDTRNRVYVIGGRDLSVNRRRILHLEG